MSKYVTAFNYLAEGFKRVTHWVKRKTRINDVRKFDKSSDSGDESDVNERMRNLKDRAELRKDSQ